MLPQRVKAIVISEAGKAVEIQDAPLPKIKNDWVLVHVHAVGVNPTDWKHVDYFLAGEGSRLGCDYAGVVEDVGSHVTTFKKGDRIAGFVHGGDTVNHDNGAFAEYIVAKAGVQIKIPDNISLEQAATFGVSLGTVAQGFYRTLGLPLPLPPHLPARPKLTAAKMPVLIYGGTTATGIYAIQFAKLSGFHVITTCSPHNMEYLTSIGADTVFDYKSPSCGKDIKQLTSNKLQYAWDCTGLGAEICAAALSDSEKSYYATIIEIDENAIYRVNPMVYCYERTLVYDCLGDLYVWADKHISPDAANWEALKYFVQLSRDLLEKEVIEPVGVILNQGGSGLEGVLKGLDLLRQDSVSAGKLVYTL